MQIPTGMQRSPDEIVSAARARAAAALHAPIPSRQYILNMPWKSPEIAASENLKTIFVTNGYIAPRAIETIAPFLDAANIDLKAFTDDFYRKICGARLQPVLDAIKAYRRNNIWIEITTLIIPGTQ